MFYQTNNPLGLQVGSNRYLNDFRKMELKYFESHKFTTKGFSPLNINNFNNFETS